MSKEASIIYLTPFEVAETGDSDRIVLLSSQGSWQGFEIEGFKDLLSNGGRFIKYGNEIFHNSENLVVAFLKMTVNTLSFLKILVATFLACPRCITHLM